MDVPLGKGVFLIATPALRDPNFRQTVILVCEHGPEGALGVVLNRPTEMNITEVLPQMPVLEGQPHRVFCGGPVQKDSLLVLYHLNEEVEVRREPNTSRRRVSLSRKRPALDSS